MKKYLDSDGNRVTFQSIGLNGRIHYGKGGREEVPAERKERERVWRSLGKKVRKGSFIK